MAGPSFAERAPESIFTHAEYAGREGESPAEKTLRDAYNSHGMALQDLQAKSRETGPGPANPTPVVNHYPLDQDGDEDK